MSIGFVIGIDPGLKGALALMRISDGEVLAVADMPTMKITLKNGKKKTKVCAVTLHKLIKDWFLCFSSEKVLLDQFYLESVTSHAGEGHAGAFSFGEGFGVVKGVIGSFGIEPVLPAPITWKTYLNLKGMSKEQTTAYAAKLYPKLDLYSKRKNRKGGYNALDGRGDAVLLCVYARSLIKGNKK